MSEYITNVEQLSALATRLEGSKILCIDTEFLREKTYYARLCLLQINNGSIAALIDPIAVKDLSALVPILTDKNCVKVFHAGSQDIGILYHETGVVPTPVFDTQAAASLLGFPLQVGYGPLVRAICDVNLPKADSYTDWSRRPLTSNQLKYALDDVVYLPQIFDTLKSELESKHRLHWLDAEFADLSSPAKYENEPREMWRKVKRVSTLSRGQLAIAREVAAWREREGMRRNIPRKWVLPDEALVEIARKAPRTREGLLEVRGLTNKLNGRDVNQILEAVREGKALPQSQWPKLDRKPHGNTEVDGAVELLAALVEIRAKQNDVAAPILATHADLTRLARGHRDGLPVLTGWRYELVGRELVDMLDGKLVMYLENGAIEVTERHQ